MSRTSMVRAATLVASLALLAAHAPEAAADSKPARADQAKANALFERAQKHYQAGEYNKAIALFAEAYELVRDPVYLFNLGQTYRKVLDCVKASESYRRYLAEATDADAKQRERVEQWLREIAPCVEQRREEAELARRAEEAERARREEEERRRQREAATPRYRELDRGRSLRLAGIAAAGAGVIGLGLGAGFTIRSSQLKSELAEDCADTDGCDWALLRGRDSAGRRANVIAVVGWVGGGLAAAGGVTLYLLGRSRIERVQVTPVVEGSGATVSARLSF